MAATKTQTPAKSQTPARPEITTFDRFRGVLDGTACACKNSHITEAAARACVQPPKAKREGHEVTVTTVPRYNCVTGDHRYGHKSERDALACAGFKSPKAAKPAAEKPAADAKPATPKPSAKGATAATPAAPAKARLRSAKAGQISRA